MSTDKTERAAFEAYPPLPAPTAFLICKGSEVTARAWNADQMRAYVDADRKARATLPSQPATVVQPSAPAESGWQPVAVRIDFKQATELLAMFGGEPSDITLRLADGHSGRGLYAYYTEYPEEGAEFLGETDDEAAPSAAQPGGADGGAG